MSANDNELQSVWMIDRNIFIQQFNLKVENPEQSLKDILADSIPEWGLDGKIHKLIVQMELKK